MNPKVEAAVRNPDCVACKLHQGTTVVCETGFGPKSARVMVVGKMPNSKFFQGQLDEALIAAGILPRDCFFTSALKCRNFDMNAGKGDLKACTPHLDAEIAAVKPEFIISLGNEALSATTGHSGIMKYRGHLITRKDGIVVMPTVAPASVTRNPGQRGGWMADLSYFASKINGVESDTKRPPIKIIDTPKKLKKLMKLLDLASVLSYDIETNGFNEWAPEARIVSLAGTMKVDKQVICWSLPLYHPESPFRTTWRSVLRHLAPHIERVPKQVAHNGKFDARWLRQFEVPAKVTFDTMIAAHLLDENRMKGLKPLARMLLGVPPWDIDTGDLLNKRLAEVLEYNALDTFYTYELYQIFRKQLGKQPRLLRVFKFILMPANEVLIEAERHGVWVDATKLAEVKKISFDMRDEIDRQLMEWVPEQAATPKWPTNSKGKPVEVNFNASNFARWWLFTHLGFPVLSRGKDKDDGSSGNPSMAEDVMLELRKLKHPVIELLLERSKWQKYCSTYVGPYSELRDENDRIHTTFKLFGTVTGRLSSGKEEAEKLTGTRASMIRGVNLQQVPRDPFIRGVFGAPPGWLFVEADYSQVELRLVAFVSRDRTMLGIYQRGEDIHRATAAWVLGVPESQISGDDRKKAKAVNFGFVYGMGARKFVETAFLNYGAIFTLDEAQEVRKAFFRQFRGLQPWHQRQRRLVNEHARVQSPLGRVRHLPDVRSEESGVRAEAERQAINSPIQSLASDMNIFAMARIHEEFAQQGIRAHVLGTVHDAINFEVHEDDVGRALPLIKGHMENLPLRRYFGLDIDVPMVADLKIGTHWGGAHEIPEPLVESWDPKWLKAK